MASSPPTKVFPLSAITRRIQEILAPVAMKIFWVRAEITSGREKGGSFYCDLTEVDDSGRVIARMRCTIWNRDLKRIREKFKEQNVELQLDDGTSSIFCCQLQYSPQYGISLKVVDADPSFAIGELEKRKQEILEGLQRDGLLEFNRLLDVPAIPRHIGLITSAGSAAFADFKQTLSLSSYTISITLADTVVQGAGTEQGLLKALDRLAEIDCDLVAIIRGGGSKTDLSYLDNDAIARRIAHYPHPVWTGIGHEIDISVLDHVAHQSFKTPTAVGEELVARYVQADRYLSEAVDRLKTVWTFRLQGDTEWLERAVTGLQNGVRKMLDIARSELREAALAPWAKVSDRLSREQVILSENALRMKQTSRTCIEEQRTRLQRKAEHLEIGNIQIIDQAQHQLSLVSQSLNQGRILRRLHNEQDQLNTKLATLQAHDPKRIVQRGFALIKDADHNYILKTAELQQGQQVQVTMSDGQLTTTIDAIQPKEEPS